jgi:hypothetical protein
MFDNLGGSRALQSVSFTLLGIFKGTSQVENINDSGTSINATLSVLYIPIAMVFYLVL